VREILPNISIDLTLARPAFDNRGLRQVIHLVVNLWQ
jgi:hypothetical protein